VALDVADLEETDDGYKVPSAAAKPTRKATEINDGVVSESLTVVGDYCLRSAVLGGARMRPAHAAVRSESG
jgi:hypothetical protein